MNHRPDRRTARCALPRRRHRLRLLTAAGVASCLGILLGTDIAAAHIDPDPAAVAAGSAATVGFTVEHGCDGSNTTRIDIKIPDGITDAAAVDKPGWTTAAANGTVTFSGGNLDAATHETFSITFTAPATPGDIHFPIVQTCVVGDLAWIEIPVEGQPEPDHPAPTLMITDGPPTSAELAPPADDAAGSDATAASAAGSTAASMVTTDAESVVVTAVSPSSSPSSSSSSSTAGGGDDGSNSAAVVVAIIAGGVVVVGAAAVVAARRKGLARKS